MQKMSKIKENHQSRLGGNPPTKTHTERTLNSTKIIKQTYKLI